MSAALNEGQERPLAVLAREGPVDLEEVLRQVVDEVVIRLGADRGTLYLVDHVKGELVSRVAHLPELAEIRLKLGEGVAGRVARTGEVVRVDDAPRDARVQSSIDRLTGYQTERMLAAPVRAPAPDGAGPVVGVLQVLNKLDGPFDAADERRLVGLAREVGELLDRTSLRSQLRPEGRLPLAFRFNHIVGESSVMRDVYERTARAARTEATVLVRGESGSGKEAIARAVHWNSPRKDGPFVKVDCAALPEALVENELFGHERGAFTGADRTVDGKVAMAEKGTLFLDEIGELPLAVQGKLLRLVQERSFLKVGGREPQAVDARLVAATHRDLEADVQAGRFRADLYYRLRVAQIDVPPLRTRGAADLDRLIDHFLYELGRRHGRPEVTLSPGARQALHAHMWPGNVRELEHAVEGAVVMSPKPTIEREHLSLAPAPSAGPAPAAAAMAPPPPPAAPPAQGEFRTPVRTLREVERAYLDHVLATCNNNRSQAARVLGIGRNTLLRKLAARDEAAEAAEADEADDGADA